MLCQALLPPKVAMGNVLRCAAAAAAALAKSSLLRLRSHSCLLAWGPV